MAECITPPTRRGHRIILPDGSASQELHRFLEELGCSIADTQGDPGPAGPQGPPGDDGSVFFNGSGAPNDILGDNGDQYIDSDTTDYYAKIGGTWVFQFTLRDPGFEAECAESMVSGHIVNIYDDGGVAKVRLADARFLEKPANGFVRAPFSPGETATIYQIGRVATPIGATLGTGEKVWLSETPGEISITPITTSGSWLQPLGWAHATGLLFEPNIRVRRA